MSGSQMVPRDMNMHIF